MPELKACTTAVVCLFSTFIAVREQSCCACVQQAENAENIRRKVLVFLDHNSAKYNYGGAGKRVRLFLGAAGAGDPRNTHTRSTRQAGAPLAHPTPRNAPFCAHPALFGLNLAFPGGVFLRDAFIFGFAAFFLCAHAAHLYPHTLTAARGSRCQQHGHRPSPPWITSPKMPVSTRPTDVPLPHLPAGWPNLL